MTAASATGTGEMSHEERTDPGSFDPVTRGHEDIIVARRRALTGVRCGHA